MRSTPRRIWRINSIVPSVVKYAPWISVPPTLAGKNPTTGYRWTIRNIDEVFLQSEGDEYACLREKHRTYWRRLIGQNRAANNPNRKRMQAGIL